MLEVVREAQEEEEAAGEEEEEERVLVRQLLRISVRREWDSVLRQEAFHRVHLEEKKSTKSATVNRHLCK